MATEGATTEAAPETSPPPYTQIFMPPSNLPPPKALVLDDNVASNWKAWKKVWSRYEIATGISKQESLTVASVHIDDGTDQYEISTGGEQPSHANKALVNLYVNRRELGNKIRFQVDTGSECDLLPLKMYKSITGDNTVERLEKCSKSIVSYTAERKQIAEKVSLPVWHKDRRKTLTFYVVNGDYQPVLLLNRSIMLGIHEDGLSVSPTRLQEFKRVTECDPEMQLLISAIHKGWPLSRKDCPAKLVPHYDSRSELVEDSGLVYRGVRLVVPHLLRADMLKEIHRDKLAKQKAIQKERYNAKSRPLTPLQPDQAIRMKLPGDTKWSLGSCVKAFPNRSYEVKVAGRRYRRNRRQLRTTAEIPPSPSLEDDSSHHLPQTTRPRSASQKPDLIIDHDKPADVPSLPI
ncbi:hypothetical protein P5673_032734, partial [Acropora cervicornis]